MKIMKNLFALVLVCMIAFSCKSEKKDTPAPGGAAKKDMPVQVEGFVVISKNLVENLEVPGTLLPYEETEIRSEISGRLVFMNIQEGGQVKQGALLAKLFDEDLQAQLKKLQVQLEIAKKTLELCNTMLDLPEYKE